MRLTGTMSYVDARARLRQLHGVTSTPVERVAPIAVVRDDAALVRAARGGDRDAFGRLYELYAPMVHGILLASVPRTDVSDLLQDVFVAALAKLGSLREEGAFGGWLARIARNRAHDFHRGPKLVAMENEDDDGEQRSGVPATAATHVEDAEAAQVLELIRTLPEAYRETLILRLVEGMTGPEIAERTGLTPGSVRVNLHRGMALLREALGGDRR